MRRSTDEVREILRREGVISRRGEPGLARAMSALAEAREITAILPGIYVATSERGDFAHRVRAAAELDPDLVFVRPTAAKLTFWPACPSPVVEAASRWQRAPRPGYSFSRRAIPPELVVEHDGIRVTDPALTALDLCDTEGGNGIDEALRSRWSTLARMRWAADLTPGRPGNVDRRRLLLDSRDEPWSEAERLAHRLLRRSRIDGWKANLAVQVGSSLFYVDIAFASRWLAIEIDGRLHEEDPKIFQNDRIRQNALVLDGWMVLRFTWETLQDDPASFLAEVRQALRERSSARSPFGAL